MEDVGNAFKLVAVSVWSDDVQDVNEVEVRFEEIGVQSLKS